ncbi:MAG TPA: phage tail protein [Candidatus Binatia bacterium]
MAGSVRNDPYKVFNFIVEIDGIAAAGFSECSGLSTATDIIEYREGNERGGARKLPGLTKFANIVLKRGLTRSLDLWNWRKTVINGAVERKSGAIVLLADDHTPAGRFRFHAGWPAKWEGPALNAKSSEVAIETLEIAHEGLEIEFE